EEPAVVHPTQRLHQLSQVQVRRGATQQIVVELTAPDGVADRAAVVDARLGVALPGDAKTANGLQREASRLIDSRVKLERGEDLRRDPPGADLVAREPAPIADDDAQPGAAELPRAGRAGRAAADDQDVTGSHHRRAARSQS